jgi:signal transduction histidine kinase
LLKYLRDYARAVLNETWQRQSMFVAVALLTGAFFVPWKAALFFAVCMGCEFADLTLARRVLKTAPGDKLGIRLLHFGFLANTIVSALAISIYAVWVGTAGDGDGRFTALFCLFAAALYAAINNHQIVIALAIRLTIYGISFLLITVRDIWVFQPSMSSPIWLHFFTVVFVMYFLIDCSIRFLRMYRQDLRRLADLEVEHERAKAALVLKSQLVAVVSHELRTPLTSIKGSLDLVNSGKFGELPPQMKSLLGLAGRNSQRLATLVDDLLDLQKLEERKMKFDKETVDIRAFLSDAGTSHEGLAERYNVRLNVNLGSRVPVYVNTDRSRLMQVIGNIISNAAKFSPDRGDVDVWYEVSNAQVKIFVRDHGIGIPEGSKEQVFGRFTQLDSSDQRQFGGTGLGMNISREIISALGGTIDYESELGVGTTFEVVLPCATVHEAPAQADAAGESQQPMSVPLRSQG